MLVVKETSYTLSLKKKQKKKHTKKQPYSLSQGVLKGSP